MYTNLNRLLVIVDFQEVFRARTAAAPRYDDTRAIN